MKLAYHIVMAIEASIDKKTGKLTIIIDTNPKPTLSGSGKSKVVATTNGNVPLEGVIVDGKQVILGLNAYYKA